MVYTHLIVDQDNLTTIFSNTHEAEQHQEPVQWFVMNAYHAELKAEQILQRDGFQCYVPKHYILRRHRTGTTRMLVPVIPNLVFVRSTYHKLHTFQRTLTFLSFATMPRLDGGHSTMKVPDSEMDNFIRVTSHAEEELRYFRPEEVNLTKGQRIRIIGGLFDGTEGTLLKVKGIRERRLVVSITGLIAVAATHIEPEYIQLL